MLIQDIKIEIHSLVCIMLDFCFLLFNLDKQHENRHLKFW